MKCLGLMFIFFIGDNWIVVEWIVVEVGIIEVIVEVLL